MNAFRSTPLKVREMGPPVYLPAGAAVGACAWDDVAIVVAAAPACCTACWAAACCVVASGRTGSFFPLNDANVTEGWVSPLGKPKRGAEIFESLDECREVKVVTLETASTGVAEGCSN